MPVFTAIDDENPARAVLRGRGVFEVGTDTAGPEYTDFSGGTLIGGSWQEVLGCSPLVEVYNWAAPCPMIHGGVPMTGIMQCTTTMRWQQKPAMVYNPETNEYSMGCAKDGPADTRSGCDGCTPGVLA